MGVIRQGIIVIGVVTIIAIQGCSLAPTLPDPEQKQGALDRWNRCVQRFEKNPAHYCDGHRRDVLASYPPHLEDQINSLLRQKTRSARANTVLKTGMENVLDASRNTPSEVLLSR